MGASEGGSVVVDSCMSCLQVVSFVNVQFIVAEIWLADYTASPVLTVFIWESGSHFDTLCNQIQNEPTSVLPSLFALMNGTARGSNGSSVLNSTLSSVSQ